MVLVLVSTCPVLVSVLVLIGPVLVLVLVLNLVVLVLVLVSADPVLITSLSACRWLYRVAGLSGASCGEAWV